MSQRLQKSKQLPSAPGVYIFRLGRTPLYIGKAANLKKRLASYFQKRAQLPAKIQRMLTEATRLETIQVASEIEALIKETELIKRYRPKYNVLMRDDKTYLYVGVTKELFPKILITHEPQRDRKLQKFRAPRAHYLGPFTSSAALRQTLKLLRRIFPYCTCKIVHKRPCLNSEMGRCLGYCCTMVEVKNKKSKIKNLRNEYRKNIHSIVSVLEGGRTRLMARFRRELKEAVKRERYEEAGRLRDAIFGLEDVFAHRQVLHSPETRYAWPILLQRLHKLLKTSRTIRRIEGYDIANIGSEAAAGSMVVFRDGTPDKSQYRKFRIKTVKGISDVDMLKEVLRRRIKRTQWSYPQLIVIDGGKPQLNAALEALKESGIKNQESRMPLVTALAKREETLHTQEGLVIPLKRNDPAILHLFQRIRDESHRFARAYHHQLRKNLFNENH